MKFSHALLGLTLAALPVLRAAEPAVAPANTPPPSNTPAPAPVDPAPAVTSPAENALAPASAPAPAAPAIPSAPRASVIVIAGAPGELDYAAEFTDKVDIWRKIGTQAGVSLTVIGTDPIAETSDRAKLQDFLAKEPKDGGMELWIVMLGHGTFDGREAKFNLRGDDISATDLAEWLKPFQRPLAVIDTASASAPFMAKLAGPGRVVVTSTRSGNEHNYARFGKYFAEAVADPASDLDKDGQVSLLEAFLGGAHRTAEFYKTEGRLATEHALIDDNGDGLGTPAEWFRGVRATRQARDGAAVDGTRAHQYVLLLSPSEQRLSPEVRARRDRLELQIAELRTTKEKMPEAAYYRELEKLLLELASLYNGT